MFHCSYIKRFSERLSFLGLEKHLYIGIYKMTLLILFVLTGRVCVPIDPETIDEFDPFEVPTVR